MMYEVSARRPLKNGNSKRNAIEDLFVVHSMINQIIRETNPSKEYDLRKYYPEINKRIHDLKKEKTMKSMLYNIRKGKKEGLFREDLDEEIISKMYLLRMSQIPLDESENVEEYTSSNFLYEMFIYLIFKIIANKNLSNIFFIKYIFFIDDVEYSCKSIGYYQA